MKNTISDRVLVTASAYAKEHLLYVQEIGALKSLQPHISHRQDLHSLLFLIVTVGHGTLTYKGRIWELRQGDCAWIDCTLPYSHESSSASPWELKWVHFYGRDALEFYTQFLLQGSLCVFTPGNPAVFNECLSSLLTLQKQQGPYKELLSHKYLTELCTSCFPESKNRLPGNPAAQNKLVQIREYLFAHYAEKISLDDLSQIFFISKYHLIREYRKCFGVTPGNDLIACRISHAKTLLRFTPQSIEEISILCGFHNAAYFIRMFKRAENMTPLEYRRKW